VLEAHTRDVQPQHDGRPQCGIREGQKESTQQTEAPFIRVENNEKRKTELILIDLIIDRNRSIVYGDAR